MSAHPSSPPALQPISFTRFATDLDGFAKELGASFSRFGFAVIADHGLDQGRINAVNAAAKAFFALPEADKRAYILAGAGGQRGYTAFGVETAKGATVSDLKEFWHIGRDLPADHAFREMMPDNVWPDEIPTFESEGLWLFHALDDFGVKVLCAIAHYLGLTDHWFDETVRDGNSVLRLLHYPPIGPDAPGVRAGAHEDINTITLLLGAEEAGLEVLDRDGRWLPINPPAGSIVCNIGDMLSRLTNNVLPSTTHRVVNPPPERRGVARYSMPFFLHFAPDFLIKTLPGCISAERPDAFQTPITAHDFLQERLREIKLA